MKKHGPDKEIEDKLVKTIGSRFTGSERAVSLGEDTISRLEHAFEKAEKDQARQKKNADREEIEKKEKMQRQNSPERTDPRCVSIMEAFSSGTESRDGLTKKDLIYLTGKMIGYRGEEKARLGRPKVFEYLENYDATRERQAEVRQQRELERSQVYEDDDPSPRQMKRLKEKNIIQQ